MKCLCYHFQFVIELLLPVLRVFSSPTPSPSGWSIVSFHSWIYRFGFSSVSIDRKTSREANHTPAAGGLKLKEVVCIWESLDAVVI